MLKGPFLQQMRSGRKKDFRDLFNGKSVVRRLTGALERNKPGTTGSVMRTTAEKSRMVMAADALPSVLNSIGN